MSRTARALAVLGTAAVATTACSGSPARHPHADAAMPTVVAQRGTDGVQQLAIGTTDGLRFVPSSIRAHVGTLRIVLADRGSYPHNISFPSLHVTSSTVSGNPGQQQTTLTLRLTRPGTYRYLCTFHSSAGMTGNLIVDAST